MPAERAPETRPIAAPFAWRAQAGLIVAAIALVETGWLGVLGFGAYKLLG